MRTPPEKRNSQKFYDYHNDHGHQTKDCLVLRREIELLIQNGKLVKFVANEKRRNSDTQGSPQRRITAPPKRALLEDGHNRKEGQECSREPWRTRGEHEQRDKESTNRDHRPHPQNQLIVKEIHTISGGLAGGGESTSARKALARSIHIEEVYQVERPHKVQKKDVATISFSDKDVEGVSMPHDDALVVIMTIANHTIHRILVDNGSSAKIIYWSVI
jgi:hypothetical protein